MASLNDHDFCVNISKEDWNKYTTSDEYISTRSTLGRSTKKTFLASFSYILSKKLQEIGVLCWLINGFNWFNPSGRPHWHGSYKCAFKDCPVKYACEIASIPDDQSVEIFVKKTGVENHTHRICKPKQIRGKARERLAERICADGVSNTLNRNICSNRSQKQKGDLPENANYLSVVKYWREHKFRVSTDHIVDSEATKRIMDFHTTHTDQARKAKKLIGYVQKINQVPFGLLMVSELQIDLWHSIRLSSPIWYFDATGSVLKPIENQSAPFLYSIVFHDSIQKFILPLAEFFTTSQTMDTIAEYLFGLNNILTRLSIDIAPIIVTDNSWALIGAVMKAFNSCDTSKYINWCYDILIEFARSPQVVQLRSMMRTRLVLCSGHYVKNFIKDVRKVEKNNVDLCHAIIYAFTLLQDCLSIEQFNLYLSDSFNLFNSPIFDDRVKESYKNLKAEIANRYLNRINVAHLVYEADLNLNSSSKKKDIVPYIMPTLDKDIKRNSKFLSYYDGILNKEAEQLKQKEEKKREAKKTQRKNQTKSSGPENPFYSPKLFNLISERLYLVPLWSSLMLGDFNNNQEVQVKRQTNNIVEGYFKHLKHGILKNKIVTCSEFTELQYDRIDAKHHLYFENSEEEPKSWIPKPNPKRRNKKKSKRLQQKKRTSKQISEMWSRGISRRRASQSKSLYMGEIDYFGKNLTKKTSIGNKVQSLKDLPECVDFQNAFKIATEATEVERMIVD